MNNLAIAEKLVIVRKTARGLWAIYVPGLPGLRTLREVFTDRSEANARARRVIIDVMEILNAADRMRLDASRGKKNGAVLTDLCEQAVAGKLTAGELRGSMMTLLFEAHVDGQREGSKR